MLLAVNALNVSVAFEISFVPVKSTVLFLAKLLLFVQQL